GGVQIQVWSDDWGSYAGNWTTLDGTTQTGDWVVYTMDLDAVAGEFDPRSFNGVGFAFHSGGDGSEVFDTAVFEVDWVGVMPGGAVDPSEPDAGTEEPDGSVAEPDAGDIDLDAGFEVGIDPPEGALWFAVFDVLEGFVDTYQSAFPE